ncbi:MAG: hypothetical protein U1D55_01700 [Phycisphaerae bacterium]
MSRATPRRPATRHAWLYALPEGRLPESVECRGERFTLVETFKHDFFAATGLYRGPRGLAVLKLGRASDLVSIPTAWIGEFLTRREVRIYSRLQDQSGVPELIGKVGRNGFLHAFVPGHPLGRDERVSDTFFDELFALLRALHERDIAYVDLNKRQNVLMGDDGRPYLIDFQISLDLSGGGWRRWPPMRWLLARFQQADWYHALKHKRRLRPDLLTPDERLRVERLSIWIRLHRAVARPLTNLRRRALRRLHRSETQTVAGSATK